MLRPTCARRTLQIITRPSTIQPLRQFITTNNGRPSSYSTPKNNFSTTSDSTIASLLSYTPKNPSKRDPKRGTERHPPDQIERLMQKDNFRNWGFVLYRCTYKSDSDWAVFMRRYLNSVRLKLERMNGLDLLDSFAPTVLEDPRFEGASSFAVRDYFKQWVSTATSEEQGISAEDAQLREGGRYKFCLMVDEEALQSVLNARLDRAYQDTGYVILVNGEWKPEGEPEEEEKAQYEDWEPEVFDPVDGCTEKDVGCMRVRYDVAQVSGYAKMCNFFDWELEYRRPPEIGFKM